MHNKSSGQRRASGVSQDGSYHSQNATTEPKPVEELTQRDLIRMQNCKTSNYYSGETYPSIKPAVSRCDPNKTAAWMSDALEASGCARLFDMKQDDLMTVWSASPNKESLKCYGAGTESHAPEAVRFNQALAKSLQIASDIHPAKKQVKFVKPQNIILEPDETNGTYVLNRQCLQHQLDMMPTVKRKLNPTEALNWYTCPGPVNPECPFCDTAAETLINLNHALGMERQQKKRKQSRSIRRKYHYCQDSCAVAPNKCSEYEWHMYQLNPKAHDEAFKLWQDEKEAVARDPEPKNYEELYSRLVGCFERDPNQSNNLCALYEKCCKREEDPKPQGCGEHMPENAGDVEIVTNEILA